MSVNLKEAETPPVEPAPELPSSPVSRLPFLPRFVILNLGLALYGIGLTLMIQANVGLAPWDAFHVGLSQHITGLKIGMASIAVGLVCQTVAALWLKMRVGIGSVLNMFLIGWYIDQFLPYVTRQGGDSFLAWGMFLGGILLVGLATGTYIASNFGAGPRDSLALGVSRKYNLPIRYVRTGIEIIVLGAGWLLGAKIGWGTLVFAVVVGPAMQMGMWVYRVRR